MKTILRILAVGCYTLMVQAQTYQGTQVIGSSGTDLVQAMAVDALGNVYTAGNIGATVSFGSTSLTHRGGNADGFLAKYSPNGTPLWIKPFASGFDDVVTAITVSSAGDIFLTGYFQGAGSQSFDADPNAGVFLLSQPSAFLSRDCFIIKLDANGDFVWAKQVSNPSGGAAQEDSFDIEVDELGNVYVAGRFVFADFDPGAGTQTILTPTQGFEGFLLKLNSNGDFLWVNHLKNAQNAVRDITIASNGDVLVTGEFAGTIDVSGTGSTPVTLTSNGGNDIFVVRYDSTGSLIWSNSIGGTGADSVHVITKNNNNEYFIGGQFNGTMDINPSSSATLNVVSNGSTDGFVLHLDGNGLLLNHYVLGGAGLDEVDDINVTLQGNVIVTGTFNSTVDFDAGAGMASSTSLGSTDAYVLSLNSGNFGYNTHFIYGGSGNSKNTLVSYNATLNTLSLAGGFSSTVDFDPGAGFDSRTSVGLDDGYLMQLNSSVLSFDDTVVINDIVLFPNPAKEQFTVRSGAAFNEVQIITLTGVVIKKSVIESSTNEYHFSAESLVPGIYMIRIVNDAGVSYQKLIVQ